MIHLHLLASSRRRFKCESVVKVDRVTGEHMPQVQVEEEPLFVKVECDPPAANLLSARNQYRASSSKPRKQRTN